MEFLKIVKNSFKAFFFNNESLNYIDNETNLTDILFSYFIFSIIMALFNLVTYIWIFKYNLIPKYISLFALNNIISIFYFSLIYLIIISIIHLILVAFKGNSKLETTLKFSFSLLIPIVFFLKFFLIISMNLLLFGFLELMTYLIYIIHIILIIILIIDLLKIFSITYNLKKNKIFLILLTLISFIIIGIYSYNLYLTSNSYNYNQNNYNSNKNSNEYQETNFRILTSERIEDKGYLYIKNWKNFSINVSSISISKNNKELCRIYKNLEIKKKETREIKIDNCRLNYSDVVVVSISSNLGVFSEQEIVRKRNN